MVLDELLDEAPVTCARSYGGPLLPPMMLREPITDLPRDIPGDNSPTSATTRWSWRARHRKAPTHLGASW